MVTEIKHYISRISKDAYWHCAIDNHDQINVSSKNSLYLKLRIKKITHIFITMNKSNSNFINNKKTFMN